MTAPFITVAVGPRNAHTDPATGLRYYRWHGRDLPSVTTIRRLAGVPHGLHQWSLTQVIDYALDHLPSLWARAQKQNPDEAKKIRRELRGAATAERDAAAELGTAVHDAAATGAALGAVRPDVAPRLRQYLDWLRVSEAEILASEFQVWNPTVGYAGTADLLIRMRGKVWLVDLKTGKGVYPDHALQLMAYLMAEFVGSDDVQDPELTDLLHEASGMAILHLSDAGWEFRSVRADPQTWAAFRGLLAFGTWIREHEDPLSFTTATRRGRDAG